MAKKEENVVLNRFGFRELSAKGSGDWRLKFFINRVLEEARDAYTIQLVLDETPFLRRIEEIEDQVRTLKANPKLFEGDVKKENKSLRDDLGDANQDLADAKKKYPTFECAGEVDELKYDRTEVQTFLSVSIGHETFVELAKIQPDFKMYKVALIEA